MLVVIAAFVGFEFVDPAVAFLAEVAEEGLECFAGGFGLEGAKESIREREFCYKACQCHRIEISSGKDKDSM